MYKTLGIGSKKEHGFDKKEDTVLRVTTRPGLA
jgi:hypothetical protein